MIYFPEHLVGKAFIECQHPQSDLYSYYGKLDLCDDLRTTIELTENNLLLRGSRLKNTEWVIGCAVYTGEIKFTNRDQYFSLTTA